MIRRIGGLLPRPDNCKGYQAPAEPRQGPVPNESQKRAELLGIQGMTKTELFTEYASYHADRRNRICHAFGIPLIVLGIMGLGHLVRIGPVDLAVVAAVVVLIYYAAIDLRGALISLVVFALLYLIATRLAWQVSLGAFILGWVFQFVGHKLEGTKPKFFENLLYLLIGPLYVFEEVLGSWLRPRQVT
jgi:uncharacterized membrane protein YGL010W